MNGTGRVKVAVRSVYIRTDGNGRTDVEDGEAHWP